MLVVLLSFCFYNWIVMTLKYTQLRAKKNGTDRKKDNWVVLEPYLYGLYLYTIYNIFFPFF